MLYQIISTITILAAIAVGVAVVALYIQHAKKATNPLVFLNREEANRLLPNKKGVLKIPDSVMCICDNAFMGRTDLTSVVIPNSVTRIGERAFWWCTALTSVIAPDGVTVVKGAFEGCPLKSITVTKR